MFQSMLSCLFIICLQFLLLQGCPFLIHQQQLFASSNVINNLPADHHHHHHERQFQRSEGNHEGLDHDLSPPPLPPQHIQSSQSLTYGTTSSSSLFTAVPTPSDLFCMKTKEENDPVVYSAST